MEARLSFVTLGVTDILSLSAVGSFRDQGLSHHLAERGQHASPGGHRHVMVK